MYQIDEGFKKLFSQYQSQSPNLVGYLNSFLDRSQDIEEQGQSLFTEFDLDFQILYLPPMYNENLDNIGALIGLPRFSIPLNTQYFQFDVTPLDEGYRFGDGGTYVLIEDELYYRALKAWTITMNSIGDVNSLILSLSALFNINNTDMRIATLSGSQMYKSVSIDMSTIFLNWDDLQLYNYITPSGSRLWPKIAAVFYSLNHL